MKQTVSRADEEQQRDVNLNFYRIVETRAKNGDPVAKIMLEKIYMATADTNGLYCNYYKGITVDKSEPGTFNVIFSNPQFSERSFQFVNQKLSKAEESVYGSQRTIRNKGTVIEFLNIESQLEHRISPGMYSLVRDFNENPGDLLPILRSDSQKPFSFGPSNAPEQVYHESFTTATSSVPLGRVDIPISGLTKLGQGGIAKFFQVKDYNSYVTSLPLYFELKVTRSS